MKLGQQLRRQREHEGLSGRIVAQLVGISPSYLSDIELDRRLPSLRVLGLLTKAIGLNQITCQHAACRRCGKAWPKADPTSQEGEG